MDVKPNNMLLPEGSSSIKLLGGWRAKAGPAKPATRPSRSLMGSPFYMSPEHLKTQRTADARADLWSLGITLYELLAGVPPFQGATLSELFVKILSVDPQSLRAKRGDIPEALDAIVMRCLQRDVNLRHESARALASALTPFGRPRTYAS